VAYAKSVETGDAAHAEELIDHTEVMIGNSPMENLLLMMKTKKIKNQPGYWHKCFLHPNPPISNLTTTTFLITIDQATSIDRVPIIMVQLVHSSYLSIFLSFHVCRAQLVDAI